MKIILHLVPAFLGLLLLLLKFLDKVVLRPRDKLKLQAQFKAWWHSVQHCNQLELALASAKWAGDLLDALFGPKLLSKKAISRSGVIATSILLIALSWIGFSTGEPFGITPWKNYNASVKSAKNVMDGMLTNFSVSIYGSIAISNGPSFNVTTNALIENKVTNIPLHIITNQFLMTIGTDACVVTFSRAGKATIDQVEPLGNGGVEARYVRWFNPDNKTTVFTNIFGTAIATNNPFIELRDDVSAIDSYVSKHDTRGYIILYSISYFICLFLVNTALFVGSLVLCRISLKEIRLSGRLFSAIGIVFINFITVIIFAIGLLLLWTVLAIPLLWLLFPTLYQVAEESIYTVSVFLLGSAITNWIMSGIPAKLVVLIALIPGIFAVIVGGFSVMAIKWKKGFYAIVSGFLIRCVENNPTTVILGTIVFIAGVIAFMARWMHLTAFI